MGPITQGLEQVDPRACGVNRALLDAISGKDGRSPRMRGKLVKRRRCCEKNRSIPAHAG